MIHFSSYCCVNIIQDNREQYEQKPKGMFRVAAGVADSLRKLIWPSK